ncbi:MAG: T9SS type A sorting domain-containing protein [Bacteroidia bacterium]|nr:T9SS type A sorting domain-containing protein [Bacteroidia bacterium]
MLLLMCILGTTTAQSPVIRHILTPDSSLSPDFMLRMDENHSAVLHSYYPNPTRVDTHGFVISKIDKFGHPVQSNIMVHDDDSSRVILYSVKNLNSGEIAVLGSDQKGYTQHSWLMLIDSSSLEINRLFRLNTSQGGLKPSLFQMVQSSSGDIILVGVLSSNSPVSLLGFAMRMDLSGNVIWTQTLNQPFSYVYGIVEYAPERFAIAGELKDGGTTNPYLAGIDAQGNFTWGTLIDLNGNISWATLSAGENGQIHWWTQMSKNSVVDHFNTVFIAADTSGNLQNVRIYEDIIIRKVKQLPDLSYAGIFQDENSGNQGFGFQGLVKMEADGTLDYIHQFDSGSTIAASSAIEATDLVFDSKGLIHLAGRAKSSGQNGFHSVYMTTDAEGFLPCFNYDSTTSVGTIPYSSQSFTPADTAIGISVDSFGVWMNPVTLTDTMVCSGICVWPGDANQNGIANNRDLLNVGLAFGSTGPARGTHSNTWNCQSADEWPQQFLDETGYEHADCNGDGVISEDDVTAISLNYGLAVTYKNVGISLLGTNTPSLSIRIKQDSVNYGDTLVADITLGSDSTPVDSILGIAFTIIYNQALIDSGSMWLSYDSSWIGDSNQTLSLTKNFYPSGSLDGAIVRKDGQNISGWGVVAQMGFIIIDNIDEKRTDNSILPIEVGEYLAISPTGIELDFGTTHDTVAILNGINEPVQPTVQSFLNVFPNPTAGLLHIELDRPVEGDVILRDLSGKEILRSRPTGTNLTFQLQGFASGVYFLSMDTPYGPVHHKVILEK